MDVETTETEPSIGDALRSSFAEAQAPVEPPKNDVVDTPEPTEAPKPPATGRDATGRFAPKEAAPAIADGKQKPIPAPGQPGPTPTPAPAPSVAEIKAPQSWSATAREKWTTVPAEIQQEVMRREKETSAALKESAEARRLAQSFRETVAPYEGMIRAEGSEPMKAVQSLLQAAIALRTSPPGHKAKMVADIVRTYGVDIGMLDQALVGQPTQQQQGAPEYRDPRVDQLLAQIQQAEQQRTQSTLQQTHTEVASFASVHEFLEPLEPGEEAEPGSIRDLMAQLLEIDNQTGQARTRVGKPHIALSLEQAYDRACQMHPEVSEVLRQRKEAERATNVNASTQRSRIAASSVKSQPTGAPISPEPDSIADTIRASIASLSGR